MRRGATVRIDLRVVSVPPAGGLNERHLSAESREPDGLFRMVEGLAGQLRRELGSEATVSTAAGARGTKSVPAAVANQQARERLLVGDYVGATLALERAVEANSGFAAALERLSEAYQRRGYQEKALTAAEAAGRAVGEGQTRLQHRIRARLALLRGRPAEAEASYAELARQYPHDSETLLDLADSQAAQGAVARAVETLQKAAALDAAIPGPGTSSARTRSWRAT